jgi:hypothetical protein
MDTLKWLVALGGATCVAMPVHAQTSPSGGMWDFNIKMEGAPGGGERTGKACVSADALAAAPEQALVEAAAKSSSGGRGAAKCEFNNIQREAGKAAWQAACDGPMGKMAGSGSGSWTADSAQLQQTFELRGLLGSRTMKQSIQAKRAGDC